MDRIFLGWDQPPLHLLKDYLWNSVGVGDALASNACIVVLPTASACHRLTTLLQEQAARHGRQINLPEIVTLGEFPELLYHSRYAFAGEQNQTLAWIRALQGLAKDELELLTPRPPGPSQWEAWTDLAENLKHLHRELKNQLLDFPDVAAVTRSVESAADGGTGISREQARWDVLVKVQRLYFSELDAIPLWDLQQARHVAIREKELHLNRRLIVAFCVDLNMTQRAVLSAVQDRVTIVIAAPDHLNSKFDALGSLDYAYWSTCDLDIHSEQLHLAMSAEDQGARTVELLARFGNGLSNEQMAVTAADPELVPLIHERLVELGMGLRWNAGSPAIRSAPALLCEALADCLERDGFSDWARLARHPHLTRITGECPDGRDYLEHFDQCYAHHLPVSLDLETLDSIEAGYADLDLTSKRKSVRSYIPALRSWLQEVRTWLAPLCEEAKPRSQWREPLRQVFTKVYPEIAQADSISQPALRVLSESIDRITDIPQRFDSPVTAPSMLRAILDLIRQRSLPPTECKDAIAGIGWLETPLDDRPLLVITGMSEGIVPQMVGSDPFIPRGLRKRLRLEDNERRHARDAYALQLTLHSGRQVHFVVGRIDCSGRPLAPSRLLVARPAREVPQRVLQLYQDDGDDFLIRTVSREPDQRVSEGLVQPAESGIGSSNDHLGSLKIPPPRNDVTVEKMTVTSFGDYLRCPYRFYLRHVLGLQPCNDAAEELDPRQFGNLIHDVLEAFGKDPISRSTDPKQIEEFFYAEVDRWIERHFGKKLNATVSFQIQQAQARLAAVAVKQAERTKEGWTIKYVELDIPPGKVTVPKDPMPLIGRIDRVDYNPEQDRWAILDYKTGSRGKRPKAAHLQGGRWLSLQLPLYRHMVPEVNPERCDLGYFLIPPKASDTGVYCDSFSPAELAAADEEAKRVATAVRSRIFWPPTEPYDGLDDFAAICQSRSGLR